MNALGVRRSESAGSKQSEELQLKDVVRNVLEETRMVLPGIQALFGFQLIAVFNSAFAGIPDVDKCLHLIALLLTIVSIGCLMAPAAYHRQVERNTVSQAFVNYASKLVCIGMAPLLVATCLEAYVVVNVVSSDDMLAAVAGGVCFCILFTLWYLIPQLQSRRR